jgi:Ig-like domain from next to BRCA1 gene/WD40-like Beta Propeller Repeat
MPDDTLLSTPIRGACPSRTLPNPSHPTSLKTLLSVVLVILTGTLLLGWGLGSAAASQATFIVSLYPPGQWEGWVASNEPDTNHFGDSALYAGYYNNTTYYSLVRFDLKDIAGAPIKSASLHLSGLSGDWLGEGGDWSVQLLESDPADVPASMTTFAAVEKARVSSALSLAMPSNTLGAGKLNEFTFTGEQIALLEKRAAETGRITFRLAGPAGEKNALFAWDGGYGLLSRGIRPELTVEMGPVTTSPDAAQFVKQVVPAQMIAGQPYDVVITLKNSGSNTWKSGGAFNYALYATSDQVPPDNKTWGNAKAVLPKEVTPGETATIAFQVKAPTAPGNYDFQWQMFHNNVGWFGDMSQKMAVRVIAPPAKGSEAAEVPTPVYALLDGQFPTPQPTYTPTPTPAPVPNVLVGKILFLSDRATLARDPTLKPLTDPQVYVVNPDGTGLGILSGGNYPPSNPVVRRNHPYTQAAMRDHLSSDQRYRVFVKDALIDTGWKDSTGENNVYQVGLAALFFYDFFYKAEGQITHFSPSVSGSPSGHVDCRAVGPTICRGIAYDPAWSPTSEQIAFVSNDGGNDEIWVINRDGSGARQLTRDTGNFWDKHPSWSPDGKQIVFWSNRTGVRQIWIMDADGGNPHSLSVTGFNDWDPVWVKYTEPPRADSGE